GAAVSADHADASWGCSPAVAERPGRLRARAAARALSTGVVPITTTCPTAARRARSSTASRSGSNATSPRWQWASTSTSHGRFGAGLGAAAGRRRSQGDRACRPERPGAPRVLARPAAPGVLQERRREVHQRDDEREQDRQERLALQLASHLGTHRLGAHDRVLVRPQAVRQGRVNGLRRRVGAPLGEGRRRPEPRLYLVLVGPPELLDLCVANPRGVERAANPFGAYRLRG